MQSAAAYHLDHTKSYPPGSQRAFACHGLYVQPLKASLCVLRCPQVPEGRSGCVVVDIEPLSEANQHIEKNDVIMEIDGTPVADDHTVEVRPCVRVRVRVRGLGVGGVLLCGGGGGPMDHSNTVFDAFSSSDALVPFFWGIKQ